MLARCRQSNGARRRLLGPVLRQKPVDVVRVLTEPVMAAGTAPSWITLAAAVFVIATAGLSVSANQGETCFLFVRR